MALNTFTDFGCSLELDVSIGGSGHDSVLAEEVVASNVATSHSSSSREGRS